MNIQIDTITKEKDEQIIIQCYEVRQEITQIIDFIRSKDLTITATLDSRIYSIRLQDVFYIEAVDNRVFVYQENKVFETKSRLYELEELCGKSTFFRCSKSVLLNLMKIENISPSLNSRYIARLMNGEKVIISRKYAAQLQKRLQGERK